MKILGQRQGNSIIAFSDNDLAKLKKLPFDNVFSVEIKQSRCPGLHRKFFKVLSIVYDNLHEDLKQKYPTQEAFRRVVEFYCGHYDYLISPQGEVLGTQARSINYESLDNTAFSELYNNAIKVYLTVFLEGVEYDDLKEMIAVNF